MVFNALGARGFPRVRLIVVPYARVLPEAAG
ncbi:hypothetical protein M2283_008098 [Streptomyces pseudovenezuelae]|uniref:Uncharacterized protein n=1 Tax=Streptomyces pseudovenezuelae TaxID=67350 RepID=A0ABT6LWT0_9ACTN|nr:hypothetical protein [Streptomyces pseudovenezuelae]